MEPGKSRSFDGFHKSEAHFIETKGAERTEWEIRVNSILNAATVFFQHDVMFEVECEPSASCNTDQASFKAYLSRWMGATTKVAPFARGMILPLLAESAQAAAASCVGGDTGTQCGTRWTTGMFDGTTGPGQEMCALEVIQSNLVDFTSGPVSQGAGGISKGNAAAGTGDGLLMPQELITIGDKTGAAFLTLLNVGLLVGGAWCVPSSPWQVVCGVNWSCRWMR